MPPWLTQAIRCPLTDLWTFLSANLNAPAYPDCRCLFLLLSPCVWICHQMETGGPPRTKHVSRTARGSKVDVVLTGSFVPCASSLRLSPWAPTARPALPTEIATGRPTKATLHGNSSFKYMIMSHSHVYDEGWRRVIHQLISFFYLLHTSPSLCPVGWVLLLHSFADEEWPLTDGVMLHICTVCVLLAEDCFTHWI